MVDEFQADLAAYASKLKQRREANSTSVVKIKTRKQRARIARRKLAEGRGSAASNAISIASTASEVSSCHCVFESGISQF